MKGFSFSLVSPKSSPLCKGTVRTGSITKQLLTQLSPNQIVVLKHQDLDEVVAQELIDREVKAVLNCASTMTGSYPAQGPLLLLQHDIPIWEAEPGCFALFQDESTVSIYENIAVTEGSIIPLKAFSKKEWLTQFQLAQLCSGYMLESFIENTLYHAQLEKSFVIEPFPNLPLRTEMEGRHVLVVSRGGCYKRDLAAAKAYICDYSPVLIAVDGGADALLDLGYKPDLIIGDMDSVTDSALLGGSELVVHAYKDGYAPGWNRISKLGLEAHLLPCPGTSEDVALLMAFEKRSELIVAVGAHAHMIDFLEKGRKGMGSTLLVRMKIGAKLIDIKGLNLFYKTRL
ncbi:putative cytokinetic ring protein SteA [Paenibacillus eucommiae]|uniref:Membrane-anchored protein n=1 Tax=Paenibacillus eucommiae TaxID=1355755 RepID=A0ABS4IN53_9BACL|nr:putative cytokinetic ring protein SteA [Paenibacillus eucommiae]MBP1988995.1 putative membrane-anchored protein [Paenibacillus eucommiae]